MGVWPPPVVEGVKFTLEEVLVDITTLFAWTDTVQVDEPVLLVVIPGRDSPVWPAAVVIAKLSMTTELDSEVLGMSSRVAKDGAVVAGFRMQLEVGKQFAVTVLLIVWYVELELYTI